MCCCRLNNNKEKSKLKCLSDVTLVGLPATQFNVTAQWRAPPPPQESSPEKEADQLQDTVSQWDSTSQVSSQRSSRTGRSSRSSRSVRSVRERAEQKAQIAAKQARLDAKRRLASLRAQQRDEAMAEETEIAEAKIDLEESIALDKAMEYAEIDDEYEEESSRERRLKQHYALPNLGKVAVEDGAKACQVLCGTDNFKVIDGNAPSTENGPFPVERMSEGREAPWPNGGWGGARPRIPRDAGSEVTTGVSQGQGEVLGREPVSTTQANREPLEDRTRAPGAYEARDSEAETGRNDRDDTPNGRDPRTRTSDPQEMTISRLYATSRQRHNSEPSGGRYDGEAPGGRARPRKDAVNPPRGDWTQTAATPVNHDRARKASPAVKLSKVLGMPGRGRPRSPTLSPRKTQLGRRPDGVEARERGKTDAFREQSTRETRAGDACAGWRGRERTMEPAWDLQTPAGRPTCMRATPRPIYQTIEDEVTFRTPGEPLNPRGAEHLPTTEPMDRYVRIPKGGDGSHPTEATPRLRFDRDLEETNERERPSQRGHSPSSQASGARATEDHLESLYLQQARLMGVLQAPKVSIHKFEGDPMGYFAFIRAFEENVDKLLDDDGSKLARLTQLCTGKAARAIQCCSMLPPAEGYRKARQLLKTRFGDPFTITEYGWRD